MSDVTQRVKDIIIEQLGVNADQVAQIDDASFPVGRMAQNGRFS